MGRAYFIDEVEETYVDDDGREWVRVVEVISDESGAVHSEEVISVEAVR